MKSIASFGKSTRRSRNKARFSQNLSLESLEQRQMMTTNGWAIDLGKATASGGSFVGESPDGNLYYAAEFVGEVDLDPGPGEFLLQSVPAVNGNGDPLSDVFIAKYTPDHDLIWGTQLAGSFNIDRVREIEFDDAGNVYIGGRFASATMELQSTDGNSITLTNADTSGTSWDAYAAKLDADGVFQWAHAIGSTGADYGAVNVDANGDVILHGMFSGSVDFDPTPNVNSRTSAAGLDLYVSKFDTDGALQWVNTYAGTGADWSHGLDTDELGDVYFTGSFDNDLELNGQMLSADRTRDGFLMKIDANGVDQWVRQIESSQRVQNSRLAYDGTGNVILASRFEGAATLGDGIVTEAVNSAGDYDTFVSKWSNNGDLQWVEHFSGTSDVAATRVSVDAYGSALISGYFEGTADFNTQASLVSAGGRDGFMVSLSPLGDLQAEYQISAAGHEVVSSAEFDAAGNLYASGTYSGIATFPTGDVLSTNGSYSSNFFFKLNLAPGVTVTPSVETTSESGGTASIDVVLDAAPAGNVTIPVSSSDTSEGVVSTASLTFTPTNWNVPQSVTVVGQDDTDVDGDAAYEIVFGPAISSDVRFDGIQPQAISMVNNDDDTPEPSEELFLSLRNSQTVDGIRVANEDILAFDGTGFEKRFDGSDVGLGSFRINAFAFLSESEILISFDKAGSVQGIGAVDDSDIVKFTASSLGENTSGTFSMYLDGSDVGLTKNGEDIDGLDIADDGTLLISTVGTARVSGVTGRDEDILVFTPTSIGANSSGSWGMYFDGSDVGLASSRDEDVNAVAVGVDGALLLSTVGNFGVDGQAGQDDDVFEFDPSSTGNQTSGSFDPDLVFAGDDWELDSNDIYGLDFVV